MINFYSDGLRVLILKSIGVLAIFSANVMLARNLEANEYGAFGYFYSASMLISVFIYSGLPVLTTREVRTTIDRSDDRSRELFLSWVAGIMISTFILAGIMACCIFLLFQVGDFFQYFIVIAIAGLYSVLRVVAGYLRAYQKPVGAQAVEQFLVPVIFLVFIVMASYLTGLVFHVYYLIIYSVSIVLVLIALKLKSEFSTSIQPSFANLKSREWFSALWMLAVTTSGYVMIRNSDTVMLGTILTKEDVAIYTIAVQFSLIVVFVLQGLNGLVSARFVTLYASNRLHELEKLVVKTTLISLLSSIGALTILFLVGSELILYIFGKRFLAAYDPLIILGFSQVVSSAVGPVGLLLNMSGNEKVVSMVVVTAAVINIILNYLLIPLYGVNGAAYATSITIIGWNLILYIISIKILNINSMRFWK